MSEVLIWEAVQWAIIAALVLVVLVLAAGQDAHTRRLNAQIDRIRDLTHKRAKAVVRLRWSDGSETEIDSEEEAP